MPEAIRVKDLFFSYDKAPVLEKIDATIQRGEWIGIFGPNGGGKTTFLKLLMGLLTPNRGSIHLFGVAPEKIQTQIGYVPQVTRYDRQFPLTVLDLVLMGCLSQERWWGYLPKKSKENGRAALDQVGLLDIQHQPFGTLSGGQAQRALIARAIASEPKFLFLDEPTASVDARSQEEIYRLLLGMKGTMTIVMVSHDLQAITETADRLFCIQRELTSYKPSEVCGHFSMGLYHPQSKP